MKNPHCKLRVLMYDPPMHSWMVWLIASIVLFIIEMLSPGTFFLACFAIGALIAALLDYLHQPLWLVWTVFFVSSMILVFVARPAAKRWLTEAGGPSNVDELIGKEALVTASIAPHKSGMVKIQGEEWKADSSDEIPEGALVDIAKIEGTRVIVKKRG